MWALNLGKPVSVPQLNEAMAIELGANLLGEVIIFTIGAGLLMFEYIRLVNIYKRSYKDSLSNKFTHFLICSLYLYVLFLFFSKDKPRKKLKKKK